MHAVQPIVEVESVSKSFESETGSAVVLQSADLTIRPGQKASLIGPSGSGKSTLLSLIAGLLRPDSGTVTIDGVSISDLDDGDRADIRANTIGIALQADNLIPFLTAAENVELAFAFSKGIGGRDRRKRATSLLKRFGVEHRSAHLPRHLSGGEAQRVALAVSMANEPSLLLADEVVAQLDGQTAGHVVDEVLDADFAVLFVTHDVNLANLAEHRFELIDRRVVAR